MELFREEDILVWKDKDNNVYVSTSELKPSIHVGKLKSHKLWPREIWRWLQPVPDRSLYILRVGDNRIELDLDATIGGISLWEEKRKFTYGIWRVDHIFKPRSRDNYEKMKEDRD